MRIPAKSDYAVRAVVAIAREGRAFLKAHDLSSTEGIPFEYLQNILRDLRRAGLLEAQRGYEGGYRLARAADDIKVEDVLKAIGSPLTQPRTRHRADVWTELERSTLALLRSTTLLDLLAEVREEKRARLNSRSRARALPRSDGDGGGV